jgi:hypothetical protein
VLPAAGAAAGLEAIRLRGHRGGLIAPHRAMAGLAWTAGRLASTLLLALGGLGGFLALLPALGRFWQAGFRAGRDWLGLGVPLGEQLHGLPGGISFSLPVLAAVTPLPDQRVLLITGGATLGVVLLSFLLPARFTPLRYFLRLLALVQTTALLFFAFSPDPFPYRLEDHVFVLQSAGLVVMGLVPLLLGLTLHVFDLALWRKLLLTLLLLGHLAVFIPLKVLLHAWLILHGTAVLMPVLFLVFGLLLDVFGFVTFYGWALSWRGARDGGDTVPPARV